MKIWVKLTADNITVSFILRQQSREISLRKVGRNGFTTMYSSAGSEFSSVNFTGSVRSVGSVQKRKSVRSTGLVSQF